MSIVWSKPGVATEKSVGFADFLSKLEALQEASLCIQQTRVPLPKYCSLQSSIPRSCHLSLWVTLPIFSENTCAVLRFSC